VVSPDPAAQRVHLLASGLVARARVEILDGAGRRVWSRALEPGTSSREWGGERDAGGTAPAGVYFVRVEDARGVAVAPLHWLGRR
jgi:hypothetical protein